MPKIVIIRQFAGMDFVCGQRLKGEGKTMDQDAKLLFLKPYFQNKIWGGTRLKTVYGYDIPSDHTGE